jgi:hypothetical protein
MKPFDAIIIGTGQAGPSLAPTPQGHVRVIFCFVIVL